ncbi:MAG: Gfo/Idh/MocA family oxidoreductase [Fimbriimonadaceae bacterium]|nr:Gfo/Idh/MocA family oxidoreductase [Fimbriimonadaceae bacterium]
MRQLGRRDFLRRGASAVGALALPTIVPSAVRGQEAPSNRLALGLIGCGGRGQWLADAFLRLPGTEIVAVCDVESAAPNVGRTVARNKLLGAYQKAGRQVEVKAFGDYREMLREVPLDAVIVATPDHWHALPTVAALRAGMHVYCEKPLANSIPEGRAICRAAQDSGKVVQVGSHERSTASCRYAAELVRSGKIGQLRRLVVQLPCSDGHHRDARSFRRPTPEAVPDGLDWDAWLGHTPLVPYHPRRCHFWWRFILSYGGGEMTDRGAHVIDIGQLGADKDASGPVSIEAQGVQEPGSLYNAFWDYRFTARYADGLEVIGTSEGPRGIRFEGSEGWIFVNIHGGKLEASRPELLQLQLGATDRSLGRSPGHQLDFLQAVRQNRPAIAPAEAGHRTASFCHLVNAAMRLQRPLRWDPRTEKAVDDPAADALLTPLMRAPYQL